MSMHYSKSAVRASLLHFIFGKALNAIVNLVTIILLARWIPALDYGAYVALTAMQVSMLAFSSVGIEITAERFLPEFRTRHADSELLGFILSALVGRFATLLLMCMLCWGAAGHITTLVGLQAYSEAFRNWTFVVFCAGMLAMAVVMLEAMLHQRESQLCMTTYILARLGLLLAVHTFSQFSLESLIWIEMAASALAALIAMVILLRRFAGSDWRAGWKIVLAHRTRLRRFALFNYSAQITYQFFNADVMKLLVTRVLGVLEAGRYGFVYSLSDTVQRYLPAVLLLRMIKPVFVSRYVQTGDFSLLNRMGGIVLKLNLLMLMPVIAGVAVCGDQLLALVSGGRFGDTQYLLFGVLCLLLPYSHSQVLSLLASTLERNEMQFYAALASTIAFPCALLLLPRLGPYGAIVASITSGVIYNTFATIYLRSAGFDYRPDFRSIMIFVMAGLVLYLVASALRLIFGGWPGLIVSLAIGAVAYLLVVRLFGAFNPEERSMLNSVLPKKVFIF